VGVAPAAPTIRQNAGGTSEIDTATRSASATSPSPHQGTDPPRRAAHPKRTGCAGLRALRSPVGAPRPGEPNLNKSRVETFSDGVFAIAITLLVLTIAAPDDYGDLAHQLRDRWPALAAYVVSFLIIGIMWLNHHSIMEMLVRVDRGFFYLNLLLLLTVVLIPYPTQVLGEALRRGEGERTAAVAYSVVMTVNAYTWSALWLWCSRGRRLLRPADGPEPAAAAAPNSTAFLIGTALYTMSILVALVNAYACLAFHAALGVWYAFDPLNRRRPPMS
jgi:uncharacterized membrane protein